MNVFTKSSESKMRRALLRYLPDTRAEVVRLNSPGRARAVRALWASDLAFDLLIKADEWQMLTPCLTDVGAHERLEVGSAATPEELIVAVAIRISEWHRPIAFPLDTDYHLRPSEIEVAESLIALATCMDFLRSIADRVIASTDGAVGRAYFAWERLDNQIAESGFERRRELQTGPVTI